MNKYIYTFLILLTALSITGCDKDKDDVNIPVNQSGFFKPIKLVDTSYGETMKLTYNSEEQLVSFTEFMYGELGTLRISYNPLLMRADEVSYKDFTFDEKGRVTSFKVFSDDNPSKSESDFELQYEGAYLKRIIEDYHPDHTNKGKDVTDLTWSNGNLVRILETHTYGSSVGDQVKKSWTDIEYTDIPAKQWSLGFLTEAALGDGELEALWATYQLGALPKNLISSLSFGDDYSSSYYKVKFSYKMNNNGSINTEYWDDDPEGVEYKY